MVGGYWFWFFIRVDVAAEGNSPFRIMRADLFILSLLASATLGLDLGRPAVDRERRDERAPRPLPRRHDGAVRLRSVVQVLAHVLQARGGLREAGVRGGRLQEQPAASRRRARNLRQRPAKGPATTDRTIAGPELRRQRSHMPTFVYMTRCDGCGYCVDICPSDIMHIDKTYRRAYNIEPNMCWECYSCVKACPQNAIDCRGYADFVPLGHSVRDAEGGGEGHHLLEDQVPGRQGEGVRLPDPHHALGIDQAAGRLRGPQRGRDEVAGAGARAGRAPRRRAGP